MATPLSRLPKVVSEPLRQSARGQPCSLRLPGCAPGNETVVLCHIRGKGTGTGTKPCDTQAVYACWSCHEVIDRRRKSSLPWEDVLTAIIAGMGETRARQIEAGLHQIAGWKGC